MKAKKYVITLVIFGGLIFTGNPTNTIDLNDQTETGIDKSKIKIPING